MRVISNRTGGMMPRRAVPVSFALLVVIGLVAELLMGLYVFAFGPSILIALTFAVTGIAIWWVAASQDRADQKRLNAEAAAAENRERQALRDEEARYRDLYENAPDPMASVDVATGRIVECNRALEQLSSCNKGELLGRIFLELHHPDSLFDAEAAFESFIRTREVRNAELKLRGNDGNAIDVSMNMTAVLDAHGRIIRGRVIWLDIRERKRIEQERLALLQREREVLLEVQEAYRMKDQFLTLLSHELRTPLTSILGWTTLIQNAHLTPEKLSHGLEVISRNVRLEARLVDNILDMSKMLSGQVRFDVEKVDIKTVVRTAVDAIRPAAGVKQLHLTMDIKGDETRIPGNTGRLHQVLWNILSNAIKFTPPQGRVKVTLDMTGKFVEILVEDTGIGIQPDFLPYVFDRFRQADSSTTRRHGGLGIGLAVVRSIVELHSGSVTACSAGEGKGTSVLVKLPRKVPLILSADTGSRKHDENVGLWSQ